MLHGGKSAEPFIHSGVSSPSGEGQSRPYLVAVLERVERRNSSSASARSARPAARQSSLRELAGAVVELGVADLAVLGLLRGLEVGAAPRSLRPSSGASRPSRSGAAIKSTAAATTTTTSSTSIQPLAATLRASPSGLAELARRAAPPAERRAHRAGRARPAPARSRSGRRRTRSAPRPRSTSRAATPGRGTVPAARRPDSARPAAAASRRAAPSAPRRAASVAAANTRSPRLIVSSSSAVSGATAVHRSLPQAGPQAHLARGLALEEPRHGAEAGRVGGEVAALGVHLRDLAVAPHAQVGAEVDLLQRAVGGQVDAGRWARTYVDLVAAHLAPARPASRRTSVASWNVDEAATPTSSTTTPTCTM